MRSLIGATVLLLASVSIATAQTAPIRGAEVEGIVPFRLANGLKLLLYPDLSQARTTVSVTYFVGSRHEGNGESGMAHLLEHMLFMGTDEHPDIVAGFAEHGAASNATTSLDKTTFFESFPASDRHLRWMLELEADRMVNSKLDPSDLTSQMPVVRNERQDGENSPSGVLMERVMSAAYTWNGYRRSTIGAESDIENVPIERLRAFYHRHYQPDNALLIIAGRFDLDSALKIVQTTFGPIPAPDRTGAMKLWPAITQDAPQDGERTVSLRRVGDAPSTVLGWHVVAGAHPDMAALEVLTEVLGAPASGRLFTGVGESGLGASVTSDVYKLNQPGMLFATATVRRQDDPRRAADAMIGSIEALKGNYPATATEVARAKRVLQSQFDRAIADPVAAAQQLSQWAAVGDWRLWFLNRDRVSSVTASDVVGVARKYLKRSNLTAGFFFPDSMPDRVIVEGDPNIDSMVAGYRGDSVSAGPELEAWDPTPENLDARIERRELSGGVKLAKLYKPNRGHLVTVYLNFRFGSASTVMGLGAVPELAGQMLMRGTESLTRQQLRDAVEELGGQFGLRGGATSMGGSFTTTRDNLGKALKLASSILEHPRYDSREFEVLKEALVSGLDQQRSDPQAQAILALRRHLSSYRLGDPRYVGTIDEQIAAVQAVTLQQVREFHDKFYGTSNGEIAVVGDFDDASLVSALESAFNDWQSGVSYRRLPSTGGRISPFDTLLVTPDRANAVLAAGWAIPMNDQDAQFPALVLADHLLGGASLNSRLASRLRRDEGLSYRVQSSLIADATDPVANWLVLAIHPPDARQAVKDVLIEELRLIASKGVGEGELAAAKTGWLERRKLERGSDAVIGRNLLLQLYVNRTFADDARLERAVAAVSSEDIKKIVARYLTPEKMAIVMAGNYQ